MVGGLVTCSLPGACGQVGKLPRPWYGGRILQAELVAAASIEHQIFAAHLKAIVCELVPRADSQGGCDCHSKEGLSGGFENFWVD